MDHFDIGAMVVAAFEHRWYQSLTAELASTASISVPSSLRARTPAR